MAIDWVKRNKTKWAIRIVKDGVECFLATDKNEVFWTTDIRRAKSLALQYNGHIVDADRVIANLTIKAKEEVKKCKKNKSSLRHTHLITDKK